MEAKAFSCQESLGPNTSGAKSCPFHELMELRMVG